LARDSTAHLTMNVYARALDERLAEVTEAVGRMLQLVSTTEAQQPNGRKIRCSHGKELLVEAAGVEPDPALFDNLRRRATLAPKPKSGGGFGSNSLSS
jgi:hypothetical protein